MSLENLAKKRPPEQKTISRLVSERLDTIRHARDNGWTWRDIAQELENEGVSIQKDTLSQTFRRVEKRHFGSPQGGGHG